MIGSLAQSLTVDRQDAEDWNCLKGIFCQQDPSDGQLHHHGKGIRHHFGRRVLPPDVKADFEAGPNRQTVISVSSPPLFTGDIPMVQPVGPGQHG